MSVNGFLAQKWWICAKAERITAMRALKLISRGREEISPNSMGGQNPKPLPSSQDWIKIRSSPSRTSHLFTFYKIYHIIKTHRNPTLLHGSNNNQINHFFSSVFICGPQAHWPNHIFRTFWKSSRVGANCTSVLVISVSYAAFVANNKNNTSLFFHIWASMLPT